MATVDYMDVPLDQIANASDDEEVPAPKKAKTVKASQPAEVTTTADFCRRIRDATGWHATMNAGTWKNCTTDKSRRTLFVLQAPDGGDQFCCVGKVFNARLSRAELETPLPYDSSDEHTELHVSLSLRNNGDNKFWTNFGSDVDSERETFGALRTKAIDDAFVPLFADKPESVKGIPDSRLKRGFGKTKKDIAASLESMWGGTGMGGDGDIVRLKRKCYNTSLDTPSKEFMDKWLSVCDERGDTINYLDTHDSIRTGDTVLVWYRVLAQACAGNFHISLEARQVMRLGRGGDHLSEGSAGLAAALAAAMDRTDDV